MWSPSQILSRNGPPCPMSHGPWLCYIELYYRGIQRKANRHGMNNNKVSSHDKHPLVCPLSRDDGDVALQWWCHTGCLCIHTQLAYHLHWWLLSVAYVRSLHLEKLLLLGVTWHLWVHLKFLVFGLVDAFYWSLISLQLWHNIIMYIVYVPLTSYQINICIWTSVASEWHFAVTLQSIVSMQLNTWYTKLFLIHPSVPVQLNKWHHDEL